MSKEQSGFGVQKFRLVEPRPKEKQSEIWLVTQIGSGLREVVDIYGGFHVCFYRL